MHLPGKLRCPTCWHARGCGLCTANPFGDNGYLIDKRPGGSLTIPKDRTTELRYRLVILTGVAAGAGIDALHAAWVSEN